MARSALCGILWLWCLPGRSGLWALGGPWGGVQSACSRPQRTGLFTIFQIYFIAAAPGAQMSVVQPVCRPRDVEETAGAGRRAALRARARVASRVPVWPGRRRRIRPRLAGPRTAQRSCSCCVTLPQGAISPQSSTLASSSGCSKSGRPPMCWRPSRTSATNWTRSCSSREPSYSTPFLLALG